MKNLKKAVGMAVLLGTLSTSAVAVPSIWEASFGASVGSGDDSTFATGFGFAFPIFGTSFAGGEVSTNGFLSLGGSNGSGCCDGSVGGLLGGAARIAPVWQDNVTEVFLNTAVLGRAVFTWVGNEFSNGSPLVVQLQLFDTGRVIFGYDALPPLEDAGHRHDGLAGISAGGGAADPGEIDFSAGLPFDSGISSTVYEFFNRGPNGATGGTPDTWDLAGMNICFDPNQTRGWSVTNCVQNVPEPGSLPLLLLGLSGLAFGVTQRRLRRRVG